MKSKIILWIAFLSLFGREANAQEKPLRWDLKTCIDYALSHNIQVKKQKLSLEQSLENTRQARSERLPSLSFSSSQAYVNRPFPEISDKNAYSASYDLNSSVTLYQGGTLKMNIRQMELNNEVEGLMVKESGNRIELAIMQAFVEVLYAYETVKINENTVEVSKAQRDRGKELWEAGSLSQADLAQLESEYTSDQYGLVVAQTTLDNNRLELKQLLELGIDEEMDLLIPDLPDAAVLVGLPSKENVYLTSLGVMPEIRYNQLNIQVAGIGKDKAWAGYLPTLSLGAGIGSTHVSGNGGFGTQLKHNWSENIGLTLSVAIFSRRSNRTAVNLAKLEVENAQLNYESVQKDLLKSIETVYQNAVSAQEQFRSAQESLKAVEKSFELVQQQFSLGMKNTLEMLTEKNNLLIARLKVAQAKYTAVLNRQMLNFYEGKEVVIQ